MTRVNRREASLLDVELLAVVQRLDDDALEGLSGALRRFSSGQISGQQAVEEFGEYCHDRLKAIGKEGLPGV